MRRLLAVALVVVGCLSANVGNAMACSCEGPEKELTPKEYAAWTLARAKNVVKGDLVDVRAGGDASQNGRPVVLARMKVKEVVKGDAATGDVTLVTGFGTGDCGLGPWLLAMLNGTRELTIEVSPEGLWPFDAPLKAKEYFVQMCGHAYATPVPSGGLR
jgi:hypothetical protein